MNFLHILLYLLVYFGICKFWKNQLNVGPYISQISRAQIWKHSSAYFKCNIIYIIIKGREKTNICKKK